MYLVDTSVLSALAPDRRQASPEVQNWIVEQGEREALFVSSIVIHETQRGIAKLRRAGGSGRAERLDLWLSQLIEGFGQRVIDVDTGIARSAGELEDAVIARGRNPGLADVLIAATAKARDLTVLTANSRHFSMLEVPHFNPLLDDLPKR